MKCNPFGGYIEDELCTMIYNQYIIMIVKIEPQTNITCVYHEVVPNPNLLCRRPPPAETLDQNTQ